MSYYDFFLIMNDITFFLSGTCSVPEEFQHHFKECNSSFSTSIEDKYAYTINWSPASFDGKEDLWYYSSDQSSETLGMYGR